MIRLALLALVLSCCQVCRVACFDVQTFLLTDASGNPLLPSRVEAGGETFDCDSSSEFITCSGNRVTIETGDAVSSVKITAKSGESYAGNVATTIRVPQQSGNCMCFTTYEDVTLQLR